MNISCASCNTPISNKRYKEILCEECEIAWWISIEAIYRKQIKKLPINADNATKPALELI